MKVSEGFVTVLFFGVMLVILGVVIFMTSRIDSHILDLQTQMAVQPTPVVPTMTPEVTVMEEPTESPTPTKRVTISAPTESTDSAE